ncbi:hypothetical protein M514_01096 [Trichuris suis]|uniref:Uncharacterized protein n=1 Tax=Trichuris suis TaxID=68888 RepID=A0A085MZD2_9BILA|nr:hypothetical protein M513_01096 [Trichuris suis]KFD62578.1 hypothetical protein M514_01096 [Trichuris suis]
MHCYFILPLAVAVLLAVQVDAQEDRDADYIEEYYHRLRIGRGKNFSKGRDFYPPPGSYFYRIHGRRPPRPPPPGPETSSESSESGSNEMEEGPPPPPVPGLRARSVKGSPHGRNGTEPATLEA